MQLQPGDKFIGNYFGSSFSGTIETVRRNESGHSADRDHVKVFIALDAAIVDSQGRKIRNHDDLLIMDCRQTESGLVRNDDRYSDLILRKVK